MPEQPASPAGAGGAGRAPPTPPADPVARYATVGGVVLAVAAVLSLVAHVRLGGGVIDDAWITYRHAANLAEGRGMVYNPGERVLGTTTPGWAALLGAVGAVAGAGAIPLAARLINGLLLVAAGAVAARLAVVWSGSRLVAGLAAALVVLGPYALIASASGMESSLFNLLVLAALLGLAEGRWLPAAAAAGLAPLVRPEGALVVAVVAAAWLLAPRRRRAVPALLLVPGALLLAWMRLGYGSFLSQSVRAKRAGVYPLTLAESAGETVRSLGGALTGAGHLAVVPGLWLVVLAAGSAWLLTRRRGLWPPVVLLWGYLVFYATSRTTVFPHYVALMEPFAFLAWGAAIYAVADRGMRRFGGPAGGGAPAPDRAGGRPGRPGPPHPRAGAVLAVGALLLVRPVDLYPVASVLSGEPSTADEAVGLPAARMAFYRAAVETVGPAIPPGTSVLMPEIGVLGFGLPHVRVVDAAGLVTPEALDHLPVPADQRVGSGVGAIPTGLVRATRPDLVVTLEMFARRSVYEDPWFAAHYTTVWRWGDRDLVWGPLRIHARRDFEEGLALRALPGGVAAGPGDSGR